MSENVNGCLSLRGPVMDLSRMHLAFHTMTAEDTLAQNLHLFCDSFIFYINKIIATDKSLQIILTKLSKRLPQSISFVVDSKLVFFH